MNPDKTTQELLVKDEPKKPIGGKAPDGVTFPIHYKTKRPQRNEPCHCGSGNKYKQCCWPKDHDGKRSHIYVRPKQEK